MTLDGKRHVLQLGESVVTERVLVRHVADPDPYVQLPGNLINGQVNKSKLTVTILSPRAVSGGHAPVHLETWQFYNEYMPTGYLTNIKLSVPKAAQVHPTSLCASNGTAHKADKNGTGRAEQNGAWIRAASRAAQHAAC